METDFNLDETTVTPSTEPGPDDESPASRGPIMLGRFRLGRVLGEGGMGRVYEAYDPQLKRIVAVKVLKATGHTSRLRFANEARLQAALNHPHICKVFEVGDQEDQAFIVMQRIKGITLSECLADLTLANVLTLLAKVAEAVHEAHRKGLIHRDLKPGNIMVETHDDGTLWPYVMDFGLARSLEGEAVTLTGVVLGTPYYMAPEQAAGASVDSRCDVYALGATLYHIIEGQPPYSSSSPAAVINVLLDPHRESPTLSSSRCADDLAVICHKALAKDLTRRYETTRAFADDVQRFLDHRPILAKSPSLAYRLKKTAGRHRSLLAVSLLSAWLVLGFGVYSALVQWRSHQREQVVQTLAWQLERMNAVHHNIMMAPPHDIRRSLAVLRENMDEIRDMGPRIGSPAHGPVAQCLGRLHLRLGNLDRARTHLQEAWDAGEHSSQTAYALGRTLALIYDKRHRAMLLLGDPSPEILAQTQALKEDALQFLAQSEGDPSVEPLIVAALMAYTEGDYDRAWNHLAQQEPHPWHYEPVQLRADILRERARTALELGDADGARDFREQALSAYDQALEIAPSAVPLYRGKALLFYRRMSADNLTVDQAESLLADGLTLIDLALGLDPDDQESRLLAVFFHVGYARLLLNRGEADAPSLLTALERARETAEDLAQPSQAYHALGMAWYTRGVRLIHRRQDAGDYLRTAVAAYAKVDPQDQGVRYHAGLGMVYLKLAQYISHARADEERAVDAFKTAARLKPSSPTHPNNVGRVYLNRAGRLAGPAETEALQQALDWFHQAAALGPDNMLPALYLGRAYQALGEAARRRGDGGDQNLEQAAASYVRGAQLAPRMVHFPLSLGITRFSQALAAFERGEDPRPWVTQSEDAFSQALTVAPKSFTVLKNRGVARELKAAYLCRIGRDPRPVSALGRKDLQQAARKINPFSLVFLEAKFDLIEAEWLFLRGRNPTALIERIRDQLEPAHQNRASSALRAMGEATLLLARYRVQQGLDAQRDFEAALAVTEKAQAGFESLTAKARILAYFATFLKKRGADWEPLVERGLRYLDDAACENPRDLEMIAIRAYLWWLQQPDESMTRVLLGSVRDHEMLRREWLPLVTATPGPR